LARNKEIHSVSTTTMSPRPRGLERAGPVSTTKGVRNTRLPATRSHRMDEKAAESDDMRRPVPYSLAICEGLRAVIVLRCVQRFSIATWSMPEARETTHLDRRHENAQVWKHPQSTSTSTRQDGVIIRWRVTHQLHLTDPHNYIPSHSILTAMTVDAVKPRRTSHK